MSKVTTHTLKTINPYFSDIWIGIKTFEIRVADRDFKEGDLLHLLEYEPKSRTYTGRSIFAVISYLLDYKAGIDSMHSVFGIKVYALNPSAPEVK